MRGCIYSDLIRGSSAPGPVTAPGRFGTMVTSDEAPSSAAILETILARRSVRSGFTPDAVSRGDLAAIVACGLAAPSSKNARPWRLHVLTSRDHLDTIAAAAENAEDADAYVPPDPLTGEPSPLFESTVLESAAVLRVVPCAIALENRGVYIRDTAWLAARPPEVIARTLTAYGLEMLGLGAALENMWLAANSLGLSVAFLGDLAITNDTARTVLGLEGDLVGLLALGFSASTPLPRREPPRETQATTPVVWH